MPFLSVLSEQMAISKSPFPENKAALRLLYLMVEATHFCRKCKAA